MVAGSVMVSAACAAARSSDGPIGHAVDAALDAVGLGDSTAVGDARAEDAAPPAAWTTATATCVADAPRPSARTTVAGRTTTDLVRSTAMLCTDSGWCNQATLGVRDGGEMRALCDTVGQVVTFVIPPRL